MNQQVFFSIDKIHFIFQMENGSLVHEQVLATCRNNQLREKHN